MGWCQCPIDSWIVETVSGLSSGVVTTLLLHPLDLLKLRLQVNATLQSNRGNALGIIRQIIKNEGGLIGLYRGFTPNLVGNSASWALYFMWYDVSKNIIKDARLGQRLSYEDYFLASGAAGVGTALCTNPIWVVKTRMLSTASKHTGAYTSFSEGLHRIYHTEGLRGFYKGLAPSLFGVAHGALQFMAYEQMKRARAAGDDELNVALSNWDYLLFSGTSKAFAGTVTYPHQVLRSRLQMYDADKHYKGVRNTVLQIYRREGLRGFYKGLGPNLLRVIPSSCITFLVYENTKIYLATA